MNKLGPARIELLGEVARRGSIKAAAEALHITPSAASQQLSLLSYEAGMALLARRGRGVELTEAGRLLAHHAQVIADAVATMEAELARLRDEVSGDLRIAAFPTAARALMPSVMVRLSHRHRQLRVTLRDLESDESLAALRRDEIDVAIIDRYTGHARLDDDRVVEHALRRDALYVLVPPDRDVPQVVGLAQFRDEYWIMDNEASPFFAATLRACRDAGFEPLIRTHAKDFSVIIALVEAGLGVGLVPALALEGRETTAHVRRTRPALERDIVMLYRSARRRHPVVAAAVAALSETAESRD